MTLTMITVCLHGDRQGPNYNENSTSYCKWYAFMRICITIRMRAKFRGFAMGSLLGLHIAGLCFQRAMSIAREYCMCQIMNTVPM